MKTYTSAELGDLQAEVSRFLNSDLCDNEDDESIAIQLHSHINTIRCNYLKGQDRWTERQGSEWYTAYAERQRQMNKVGCFPAVENHIAGLTRVHRVMFDDIDMMPTHLADKLTLVRLIAEWRIRRNK